MFTTLQPEDLLPGDEFWGDPPYKHDSKDKEAASRTDFMFVVVGDPLQSVNVNLFPPQTDNACVVVPVEYADGARGSRLYDPKTQITVRRSQFTDHE